MEHGAGGMRTAFRRPRPSLRARRERQEGPRKHPPQPSRSQLARNRRMPRHQRRPRAQRSPRQKRPRQRRRCHPSLRRRRSPHFRRSQRRRCQLSHPHLAPLGQQRGGLVIRLAPCDDPLRLEECGAKIFAQPLILRACFGIRGACSTDRGAEVVGNAWQVGARRGVGVARGAPSPTLRREGGVAQYAPRRRIAPLQSARKVFYAKPKRKLGPAIRLDSKKTRPETFWATFRKEKKYFFWRKKFVSNRRSGPKMAFFCSSLWPLFKFLIWAWEKLGTSETRTPQTAILAVF